MVRRAGELNDRGAYELALEAADLAIQTDPFAPDAFVAKGWALEQLGSHRLPEARAAYERALALDPGSLRAAAGLATVLDHLGRREDARSLYRSVAERFGDASDPGADPETLEMTGWCAFKIDRLDEARRRFERALALDPALTGLRFDLALVLLVGGEDEPALAQYREGLAGSDSTGVAVHAAVALEDLRDAAGERADLRSSEAAAAAIGILSDFVARHGAPR